MPGSNEYRDGKLINFRGPGCGWLLFCKRKLRKAPCKLTVGQRTEGSKGVSPLERSGKAPYAKGIICAKALGENMVKSRQSSQCLQLRREER